MKSIFLTLVSLSLVSGAPCQTQTSPEPQKSVVQPCGSQPETVNSQPLQVDAVKRIFVDSFGDDVVSKEMQSTIVTSLVNSRRFTVTENPSRADAVLKGVALEKTSQELHSYSEGTAVRQAAVSDSSTHTETLNEAKLSLRLISPEGDVIWTTTQESKGAKYKSASGDVADLCVKQLIRDVDRLTAVDGLSMSRAQSTVGSNPGPSSK